MMIMHKISTGKIHHVSALFALSDFIQQMGFHLLFWANINSYCASRVDGNNTKQTGLGETQLLLNT